MCLCVRQNTAWQNKDQYACIINISNRIILENEEKKNLLPVCFNQFHFHIGMNYFHPRNKKIITKFIWFVLFFLAYICACVCILVSNNNNNNNVEMNLNAMWQIFFLLFTPKRKLISFFFILFFSRALSLISFAYCLFDDMNQNSGKKNTDTKMDTLKTWENEALIKHEKKNRMKKRVIQYTDKRRERSCLGINKPDIVVNVNKVTENNYYFSIFSVVPCY